jgi:predicted MFS family arabinose efflux permease
MPPGKISGAELTATFTVYTAATSGLGLYLFPAMVVAIRRDMAFSYATMGTIMGLVQASYMTCALLSDVLATRFGAVRTILGATALCAVALAAMAASSGIVEVAACLIVLGGCAAASWIPMAAAIQEHVPRKHLGKALSLISSGTSYGVLVNSILLTHLLPVHGWRAVCAAASAIVTALVVSGFWRFRGPAQANSRHAVDHAARADRFSTLPMRLTAEITLLTFLLGLACAPYQVYLSAFLQQQAHYPASAAAYAWRIIGVAGMIFGLAIGALADRMSLRVGMGITCLGLAAACLFLLNAHGSTSHLPAYVAAALFGASFYSVFGLIPAYVNHLYEPRNATLVVALGNVAVGLGGIAGNVMGGVLKTWGGSFEPVYLVLLGAALLSALLSAWLPSDRAPSRRLPGATCTQRS